MGRWHTHVKNIPEEPYTLIRQNPIQYQLRKGQPVVVSINASTLTKSWSPLSEFSVGLFTSRLLLLLNGISNVPGHVFFAIVAQPSSGSNQLNYTYLR